MKLDDFRLDLRASLSPPNHLAVTSGWSVVRPLSTTVMGVDECFSPPFAARGFRMRVELNLSDYLIPDNGSKGKGDVGVLYSGGTWHLNRIERRGTYHHLKAGRLMSLAIASTLTPLFNRSGFVLRIELTNRGSGPESVRIRPQVDPGGPNLFGLVGWSFHPPEPGQVASQIGENLWENDDVRITLFQDQALLKLDRGATGTAWIAVLFSKKGSAPVPPAKLDQWEHQTAQAWEKRLEWALDSIPELRSDIPGLDGYYRGSIASGLVCLWERPEFVVNPFIATCGMDGGAFVSYFWDICGYPPQIVTLLVGERILPTVRQFAKIGVDKHFAFETDGSGTGCYYAYSLQSYLRIIWAIFRMIGPDRDLFEEARRLVLEEQKREPANHLIDYGLQLNLLEMRGTGWEHIVASPNAERAWCLDRLADMAEFLGLTEPSDEWRQSAHAIRKSIRNELWDDNLGWFKCRHPDGYEEAVYSIQVFDALRAGACDDKMKRAVIAHLRDGAFLGAYGATSVSAEDGAHYELNDPDWSGGGAYTGDGPILAETLYEQGEPTLAWDVLRRLFWMGKHLPYYPQEHYCDRPAVPAHKRANVISGLTGAEAVIFGLAGMEPQLDGSLRINARPPPKGRMTLSGYRHRGRLIDVDLSPDQVEVKVDGQTIHRGVPTPIEALSTDAVETARR